jgi:NADP-dependent 3-hydroxy acid dehydrogenase YdfG
MSNQDQKAIFITGSPSGLGEEAFRKAMAQQFLAMQ